MFNLCSAQSLNVVQLFTKATVVTVQNLLELFSVVAVHIWTYRIVDRIGLAVTGSIGDRSEYCRRQLDGNHTN